MDLPIDQLLRREPEIRILPLLRRGHIAPEDVVLLDLNEGARILMAPPSGSADIAPLSWRFHLAPGPFDRRGSIIDSERGAAGWIRIDPPLLALDSKGAEIIPALPESTRTFDAYEGEAAKTLSSVSGQDSCPTRCGK